LNNIYHVHN